MADDARVIDALGTAIADHCIEIEDMFKTPVLVTCIFRTPGNPEREGVVTADPNLDEVVETIRRSQKRPPMRG